MVGCPASGKSTISQDFFEKKQGYLRVNQDDLGTKSKCEKLAEAALSSGKSVVLDNTNPSAAARAAWLAIAKKCKARPPPPLPPCPPRRDGGRCGRCQRVACTCKRRARWPST